MKYVLLLIFLFPLHLSANRQKIELLSLDWKPYVGRGLKHNGFISYIIKRSFDKVGVDISISYYPFARALKEAKAGKVHGYFPEYQNKELEENFSFAPIGFAGPVGFMRRKESFKDLKTRENQEDFSKFKKFKLGVVRGYTNTKPFDDANYLNKVVAVSDTENLKKLYHGRLDLLFIDKLVGKFLMEKELALSYPDMSDQLEFIKPALENKDLFICFSKKNPMYKELTEKFNKGLSLLKASGEFEQIIKNYSSYLNPQSSKLKTSKKLTLSK